MSEQNSTDKPEKRSIKNLTSLSLNWLADKLRKRADIADKIASGEYTVETDKIAKSMVESE